MSFYKWPFHFAFLTNFGFNNYEIVDQSIFNGHTLVFHGGLLFINFIYAFSHFDNSWVEQPKWSSVAVGSGSGNDMHQIRYEFRYPA